MRLWKSACQSGESGLCGRGQKAALRRAVRARTQRVNHCLTAPCESPGSGPCCCHTSEGEPTSSRWTPGRWRGFRSGPPSLSWCHPRNKSGRSCPRRCLLTGGSRKGVGGGVDTQLAWVSGLNRMSTCVKLGFLLFRSLQKVQLSIIHGGFSAI